MSDDAWMTAANKWMQMIGNEHYRRWYISDAAKRYRNLRTKRSPYQYGFSMPEWFPEAIDALNKGDEERFKAIKMREWRYMP